MTNHEDNRETPKTKDKRRELTYEGCGHRSALHDRPAGYVL
jgi:hypothetical protein